MKQMVNEIIRRSSANVLFNNGHVLRLRSNNRSGYHKMFIIQESYKVTFLLQIKLSSLHAHWPNQLNNPAYKPTALINDQRKLKLPYFQCSPQVN